MTGRDFDELIAAQRAFATWRASRPHSKAAIPEELWEMAVGLLERHSASKVGKRLGLNPTHLSRRYTELLKTLPKEDAATVAEFAVVSIPAVTPNPTAVSLRVERPDGTKLILEFQNADLFEIASFCAAVR
jgi:hypothetical protein